MVMKKNGVFEFVAGVAVGVATTVAGAIAINKVAKEIKGDLCEHSFTSPDGDHFVTLSYGSSKTAKGLTFIRIKAMTEDSEDNCKLVVFTKKSARLFGEWIDNDHFKLLIGNGKRKQCCDVDFEGEEIVARYYLQKNSVSVQ